MDRPPLPYGDLGQGLLHPDVSIPHHTRPSSSDVQASQGLSHKLPGEPSPASAGGLGPSLPYARGPRQALPTLAQLNQLLHAVPVHGCCGPGSSKSWQRTSRKAGRREGWEAEGGLAHAQASPPSSGRLLLTAPPGLRAGQRGSIADQQVRPAQGAQRMGLPQIHGPWHSSQRTGLL